MTRADGSLRARLKLLWAMRSSRRAPAATPVGGESTSPIDVDSPSAPATGPDGEWTCTMDTPMGEQAVTLTLATTGGALSGRADTAFGVQAFSGGTVDGNALAWRISVTEPMAIDLDFTATVDGDTLTGTVNAGPFGAQPFAGTRA